MSGMDEVKSQAALQAERLAKQHLDTEQRTLDKIADGEVALAKDIELHQLVDQSSIVKVITRQHDTSFHRFLEACATEACCVKAGDASAGTATVWHGLSECAQRCSGWQIWSRQVQPDQWVQRYIFCRTRYIHRI